MKQYLLAFFLFISTIATAQTRYSVIGSTTRDSIRVVGILVDSSGKRYATSSQNFLRLPFQSTAPTGVANNTTYFVDSIGRLSWINGTGWRRTFDATGITANRVYQLPNASTQLAGTSFNNDFTASQTISANGGLTSGTGSALKIRGTIATGGTGTTTTPLVLIQPSNVTDSTGWNTAGTILGINAPTGYDGTPGDFINFKINGANRFTVSGLGAIICGNNGTANFRVTGNAGANNLSATTNESAFRFNGSPSASWIRSGFHGASSTVIGASQNYANLIVANAPVTTNSSGTHDYFANMVIKPIGTITNGGANVTTASALMIDDSTTGGLTNLAFHVRNGRSRFPSNGTASLSTINFGTPGTGLYGNSTNVNISAGGTIVGSFTNGNLSITGQIQTTSTVSIGGNLSSQGISAFGGKVSFGNPSFPVVPNILLGSATSSHSEAWSVNGLGIRQIACTLTSTASTGTISLGAVNSFATPTMASSSSTTITNAATMYIASAPSAGTNLTIINPYSLYVNSGLSYFGAGIRIAAGTATANTAPLKLSSGTVNTTAEAGAMEYNGSFYQTKASGLRYGLGGAIYANTTEASTINSSENDLYSYTTQANTLATDGGKIEFVFGGTTANNTNTKVIRLYFAGSELINMLTEDAADEWNIRTTIVRANASRAICTTTINSGLKTKTRTIAITPTLANTNVIKVTGQGVSIGDITATVGVGEWTASPQN